MQESQVWPLGQGDPMERKRTLTAFADSQLASAQNISYTKVAYFFTTRSRPLKQFSDTYLKLWKLLIRRTQDTVLKSSIKVTFVTFVTPGIYLNFSLLNHLCLFSSLAIFFLIFFIICLSSLYGSIVLLLPYFKMF